MNSNASRPARARRHPDPWHLNVDLHCHSTVSDGTLAPREVVRRAHRNGVQAMALTDHDEVGGLAEAADEAALLGLCFIPGVEVSVSWAEETIHIVGLRIDAGNEALVQGLASVRAGRLHLHPAGHQGGAAAPPSSVAQDGGPAGAGFADGAGAAR